MISLLLTAAQFSAAALLPANDWYSDPARALADTYYACRREGVEGVIPDVTAAEGRASVAMMLYGRRAECRQERARLLRVLDEDARRRGRSPGEPEYVLDMLERNIDAHLQSMFSWADLPEQ